MTGSVAIAVLTQGWGENLLLVLSVMWRLLCSLSVSLAVTDGVVPYPLCTCQHYSQPLENCLLNHQLEQCIDSQSYRPITYCLHIYAIYIQGPRCQNCFLVMPPAASSFPPPEDPNPGRYPDTMALPPCPCTSVCPQMPHRCYNPEQLSNKWKNLLDRDNNADKQNHGPTLP